MKIILRAEAKAAGANRYFTGRLCLNGHQAERLVVNGSCTECSRLRQISAYHVDVAESRRRQKIRRDSDPANATKKRLRLDKLDPGRVHRIRASKEHIAESKAAQFIGLSRYVSKFPCAHGHISLRFSKDRKCVECNRLACGARFATVQQQNPVKFAEKLARRVAAAERKETQREASAKWRKVRDARQQALASGERFYLGSECLYGHHGLRYALHGTCVECAKLQAVSPDKKKYDLAYYRNNREKIVHRTQLYSQKNKGRIALQARNWTKKNPDKRNAISKSYKARRRAAEIGGDSTASIFAWERMQQKVCHWCGLDCSTRYHVDHYVPLSRGGRHEIKNLVIACPRCNLTKSAKDPYKFAASLGRLF